ncbi:MAG: hypothetical protein UT02_C0003G0002 [Parcubacteria group bacterium GW2011_GWC2_38_7]|nr:MAG: hypothetical protein UT02_C0003G0002 [Parcubacteria group bacterium GW2011_GWC2_38_7]
MDIKKITKYLQEKGEIITSSNTTYLEVPATNIQALVSDLIKDKEAQLSLITATDERAEDGCFKIWYIFSLPLEHKFIVPFIKLKDEEQFPSIASIVHSAWGYESKIKTFFGLTPIGHPDARPVILHENWPTGVYPLRKDFNWDTRPEEAQGTYQFQQIAGEGIYEIPVGPIHAGIIEPGHFRFSVAGEEIILLEPRLGYTHKGSEKLFEVLPLDQKIRLSEKLSGDSSFSHSLAFCQALEELSETIVPKRAGYLRVIYAELERLANHFGDIGAMMLDTGFNFGGAQGARLREIVMQINESLTGSRFLRGVNVCGGVTKDIEQKINLTEKLTDILQDFNEVVAVAENSASLLNRLKGTGELPLVIAEDHNATGIAAKALGIKTDARIDFPYTAYNELGFDKIEIEKDGDAYARFYVRVKEIYASIKLVLQALKNLPDGSICAENGLNFKKNAVAISVVEGWRGSIIYFVATDAKGNITRVAPRDPSFVNWPLLGYAGAHNVVPDFPLINKSFNLSYTGNDL